MRTIAGLLTLSLVIAACAAAPGSLQVGDAAPGFRMTDTDGTPVSLSDYAPGRPVLLYFHMAVG